VRPFAFPTRLFSPVRYLRAYPFHSNAHERESRLFLLPLPSSSSSSCRRYASRDGSRTADYRETDRARLQSIASTISETELIGGNGGTRRCANKIATFRDLVSIRCAR